MINKTFFLPELFSKTVLSNLFVYCAGHFLVDAICAGTIFSLLNANTNLSEFAFLVILYNVLAFGLQLPFGILSDKLKQPKYFAIIGLLVASIGGLVTFYSPLVGISLAGVGNALFHIGGGTIALNLTPTKATAPGIYVAPGAIGLLIGGLLGKAGLFNQYIFGLIVIMIIVGILLIKEPKLNYSTKKLTKINYLSVIVLLLFLAIVFRSIVGFAIVFPWKIDLTLLFVLTLGVFLGKAFGGVIGDRFGWIRTGVGGLIISALLIFFGIENPVLGIIGMFLFNFTMPITLTALSNVFTGRPGFSFGLTCMALLIGLIPFLLEPKNLFTNEIIIFLIILFSALVLFIALSLFIKPKQKLSILNSKN